MDLRPTHIIRRFIQLGPKFIAVSLVGTVITQALIIILHGGLGWGGGITNFVGVCVAIPPTYVMTRSWVWGKKGASSFRREVAPFWILNLLGLALSTVFAAIADRIWGSTLAVSGANFAGFGVLYVAKFVILDHLFKHDEEPVQT